MATPALVETMEQWVVTLICNTYPNLTMAERKAIYKGSPALKQGYGLIKAAVAVGDTQALQAATRQTYLAWVAALKAASVATSERSEPRAPKEVSQGPPDQIVPPGAQESPFRRYHSDLLDADILLVPDAQSAKPYWEHPETIVAYTPAELRVLRARKATAPVDFQVHLRWLHAQKSLFGGSLETLPPQEKERPHGTA